MFLQRDFDQVARMAVPAVFADYSRQFEGEAALQKKLAGTEEWRINIVGVRLSPPGRRGNTGDATVTYDKVVRLTDRNLPDDTTRHVASIVYEYQPKVLAKEKDRIENPFGFVVTAYRSDPEIRHHPSRRWPGSEAGMRDPVLTFAAAWLLGACLSSAASAEPADPRLRESGTTRRRSSPSRSSAASSPHIVLDADEAITEVASGLGSDCSKPDASLVHRGTAGRPSHLRQAEEHRYRAEQSGGRHRQASALVPPRSAGRWRQPSSALSPVGPGAALSRATPIAPSQPLAAPSLLVPEAVPPRPAEVIAARLAAAPTVVNSNYSIAEGVGSHDIVPSLVFDDGRFTYLRFANNREVPAVFHVQGDGSEALVNLRMEGDLLVVDRISRQLMLRAGSAVVGVWNEAFDPDGLAPKDGTTVSGVARSVKNVDVLSHGARP